MQKQIIENLTLDTLLIYLAIKSIKPKLYIFSRSGVNKLQPVEQISSVCVYKQFYWNTATPTYFCTVHGFLHATTANLSYCNRNHLVCKSENIYYLVLPISYSCYIDCKKIPFHRQYYTEHGLLLNFWRPILDFMVSTSQVLYNSSKNHLLISSTNSLNASIFTLFCQATVYHMTTDLSSNSLNVKSQIFMFLQILLPHNYLHIYSKNDLYQSSEWIHP